jgi:cytochrome c peroxidase
MAPAGLPKPATESLAALTQQVLKLDDPGALDRLIATDANVAALGRFVVTLNPSDIGKFKTPSLRNVALTAPFMHDGSVPTLDDALDLELYRRGDSLRRPIFLTLAERRDLVEFLRALTADGAGGGADGHSPAANSLR